MNTLNRRMFQAGGTVDATGVRVLERKPIIQGYRDPKTVGFETLEYENGKYYQRARDNDGNLMKDSEVNLNLSPTRDPLDAYQKQQVNDAVSQSLLMAPTAGLGASTTFGLGLLGTKFGPKLAQLFSKYVSPVTASLKPGRAVPGMKGFQPQNPYNPFSYQNVKVNPTGALLTGGTTAVTQVPKLYAQETELDTTDPNFLTAQLAIINNPDASDVEKQAARDLIQTAISPTDTIQEGLDDLGTPTPTPEPTPAPTPAPTPEPTPEPTPPPAPQAAANSLSNFFSSDAFNSALRNIGGSLVREGRFGAGLASGAAGFADEQEAKRLLEQEKKSEFEKFLLEKSLAGDGMDFGDLAKVGDVGEGVNEAIRNFEGSNASIGIMNDLIALFEEAQEKGVPVTGLQGRLERFKDEASAFLGIEKEASTATKIQNMINIVKNRQIRELLGESGRTISNLDREIVDKVFGQISFTDNPAESLKKLKEARGTLQSSARQYQRDVRTGREQLISKQAGNVGQTYMSEYGDLIKDILNIDVDKIITAGYNPTIGTRVVKIKLRGE
jgi:hypothetical protein